MRFTKSSQGSHSHCRTKALISPCHIVAGLSLSCYGGAPPHTSKHPRQQHFGPLSSFVCYQTKSLRSSCCFVHPMFLWCWPACGAHFLALYDELPVGYDPVRVLRARFAESSQQMSASPSSGEAGKGRRSTSRFAAVEVGAVFERYRCPISSSQIITVGELDCPTLAEKKKSKELQFETGDKEANFCAYSPR